MTILDTFYLLFKSNAADVKKDMDTAEKSTNQFQKRINDADQATGNLAATLLKVGVSAVTAFASFEAIKDGAQSAFELNLQLYKTSKLTGESAENINVLDKAFQQFGVQKGGFTSWLTSYTQFLQETGRGDQVKNIIPNLKAFANELAHITDEGERHFRFQQFAKANGLPQDFYLGLSGGAEKLEEAIKKETEFNRVTQLSTEQALAFSAAWEKTTARIEGNFIEMEKTVVPILTRILNFFNDNQASQSESSFSSLFRKLFGLDYLVGHPGAVTSALSGAPRGVRNNNPGNIRGSYFGAIGIDPQGFAIYATPQAGLDAEKRQLGLYGSRGINTLAAIIAKWAPSADGNNVAAYIAAASKSTGFQPNQRLDLNDPSVLAKVANAINGVENANYLDKIATAKNSINLADSSFLNGGQTSGNQNSVNIQNLNVHTNQDDPQGIANAISYELNGHFRSTISQYDDSVAR